MLSARDSRAIRAAGLALKLVERDVRNAIRRSMRATMAPVWQSAVEERLGTRLDTAVLGSGVRVTPGNPPVLIAAGSRRPIRRGTRGLVPADDYHALEFGVLPAKPTTYRRVNRKAGGTHTVTRNVRAGLPPRTPGGRVVYPAAAELAPRLAALFVQTVVRGIYEAVEEGER